MEDVMTYALRLAGAPVPERGIEVLWRDPERRTETQLAQAAVMSAQIGVPWRQLMEDRGYTADQILRMEKDRAKDAAFTAQNAANAAQASLNASEAVVNGAAD